MKHIAIFANTIPEGEAFVKLNPPSAAWLDGAVYFLSPRRIEIGWHRGLLLDEIHVFGREEEVLAWLSEYIYSETFEPCFAAATDPKVVLHPNPRR